MKIPRSQIAPILADLTLARDANAKKIGRDVAAYLLDENRVGELDSLMRDLIFYRAQSGIIEVTAVSAHELSPEVRRDIEQLVRVRYPDVKQIIINARIDMEVVGGVRLELPDAQLDMTVLGKLNQFKALTSAER